MTPLEKLLLTLLATSEEAQPFHALVYKASEGIEGEKGSSAVAQQLTISRQVRTTQDVRNSVSNLKAMGLVEIAQEWDEVLPPETPGEAPGKKNHPGGWRLTEAWRQAIQTPA